VYASIYHLLGKLSPSSLIVESGFLFCVVPVLSKLNAVVSVSVFCCVVRASLVVGAAVVVDDATLRGLVVVGVETEEVDSSVCGDVAGAHVIDIEKSSEETIIMIY